MFRVHRDFKGLLKAAQDEYDSLVELNESLRKKVAEWNKDEEIRKAVELAEYNRTHSLGSGLQERVATNRSLNTAVAIKSRLNFLSVVIVAMLLRRTSRMANCVNREKPGEHIGARCANRRKKS